MEDSEDDRPLATVRVRRGSEGWEVRQLDREAIIQRYLARRGLEEGEGGKDPVLDVTEQPGRYNRYVPETSDLDDDSDLDCNTCRA